MLNDVYKSKRELCKISFIFFPPKKKVKLVYMVWNLHSFHLSATELELYSSGPKEEKSIVSYWYTRNFIKVAMGISATSPYQASFANWFATVLLPWKLPGSVLWKSGSISIKNTNSQGSGQRSLPSCWERKMNLVNILRLLLLGRKKPTSVLQGAVLRRIEQRWSSFSVLTFTHPSGFCWQGSRKKICQKCHFVPAWNLYFGVLLLFVHHNTICLPFMHFLPSYLCPGL